MKYLGFTIDSGMTWKAHIKEAKDKANRVLTSLYHLLGRKSKISTHNKLLLYKLSIRPIMTYVVPIWAHAAKTPSQAAVIQNKALRAIVNAPLFVKHDHLHKDLNIPTIKDFCKGFFEKCDKHDNITIATLGEYAATPGGKRPRAILVS